MDSTSQVTRLKGTKVQQDKLDQPLPRKFYARDPREVSRDLLGKILFRRDDTSLRAGRIVEVEAYLGEDDPAAHAAAGKTLRNVVLFGPPAHSYVYFIYGNHYCFNVSCLPEGIAGGVLFRVLEPLFGGEAMALARGISVYALSDLPQLTSVPVRLAEAFGITRQRDNGKDAPYTQSGIWIDAGHNRPRLSCRAKLGAVFTRDSAPRYRSIALFPQMRQLLQGRSATAELRSAGQPRAAVPTQSVILAQGYPDRQFPSNPAVPLTLA